MYIPVSYWQTQGGGTFLTGSILTAWQTATNYYNTSSTVWPDASTNNNTAQFQQVDTAVTMSVSDSSIVFSNNRMVYQTYPMNATPSSSFSLNVYGEFNSGSLFYPLFANAKVGDISPTRLGFDTILYRPEFIFEGTSSFIRFNTGDGFPPFTTTIYLSSNTLFTGSNLLTMNVNTDPITYTGSIDIYINGILDASASNAIYIRPWNAGPGPNQFGNRGGLPGTLNQLNNAKIQDVFIYNRALTQAEILSNYNALTFSSYPFQSLYTTTYYNSAPNACIGWNTGDRGNYYYINQGAALTIGTTIYALPYPGSPLPLTTNFGGISDGTNYYTLNTSSSIIAVNSC